MCWRSQQTEEGKSISEQREQYMESQESLKVHVSENNSKDCIWKGLADKVGDRKGC